MNSAFERLAAAEDAFFESTFLSPVLKGRKVRVRIAGVIVELAVTRPKNFEGWGVFCPMTFKTARRVRDADLAEREQYLRLFPCVRLILCRRADDQWFGVPAFASRFQITGFVPIHFVEEVQMFETVKTSFDGQTFWFHSVDENYNPAVAGYLRECLINLVEPDKLQLHGLSSHDRDAYNLAFWPAFEADLESKRDKKEDRLRAALEHAGAQYRSYVERAGTFTVEYEVTDARGLQHVHRSVVQDNTALDVLSAGICLSGGDRNFDLQSLIPVIVRGHNQGRVVNTEGRMWDEYGYGRGGMFEDDADYDDDY